MRRRMLAAGIAALAIAVSTMVATMSAASADPLSASPLGGPTPNAKLPAAIQVDETKFKVVETLRGVGKQVYDCTNGAYVFREPMAGLFTTRGLPAGIHGKGPFWDDFDGSRVEGATKASVDAPTDPAKNVKWLLVGATANFGEGGVLKNVQFIQRTDTRGGQPPATCSGSAALAVDYTTFYVFWAPR
jgi:Protein of unknown function (DUF3455)